jgi:hypothetical protein
MKDLEGLIVTHINSGLLFPVKLDEVWQHLAFRTIQHALIHFHTMGYEYGIEYVGVSDTLNLSVYCLIKWAKTAHTTKGKEISKLYLDAYYKALER